jgi:ParB family transcriptional regulator, chromosome partitioning protein
MRLPWQKTEKQQQLDLLGGEPSNESVEGTVRPKTRAAPLPTTGIARVVPTSQIEEDPANPRTEFPDAEVDDLADDIRRRGVLQALVVHPADDQGRYRLHFGAMRLRAAVRAGLQDVTVIIRDLPADPYAQVAENLKRHGLSPLDLARFIRSRVDAGESNATVAANLGMDLTSVAHHLALLELPPVLDDAMKSGRCTSPRALYELRKLHAAQPEVVAAAVAGPEPLTRSAINALKTDTASEINTPRAAAHGRTTDALDQIEKLCGRIEGAMQMVIASSEAIDGTRLAAVGARLGQIAVSCERGSDGPTPRNGGVDGQG